MYVSFYEMPATSRVWIYQANKELADTEINEISEKLIVFLNNWKRHGDDLKASFAIKYNQFVILAVDENMNEVSGCSIDSSVNLFKEFEKKYTVDFTNKLNISFKNAENINVVSMATFQDFVKQGKINSNTIVFNNMVATKQEFEQNWEVIVANSWHKRFLVSKN
ncbi:ABC transporter ATPase [Lutibacter sp.]|uniref:ABC transporter ATPase n=1 Tax=Lutibacter sp. TaxID=1925666 RepID=UPI002733E5EC|nr:ABC transporter ATPase [Lutibacter sp.]MDP3314228.1 ABC transporter ATPase [Lutibacter sp.]